VATKNVAKKVRVLTEPDLLKASDKEYMSEEQLAFFRQRLLELRAQLLNNADDTGQHLRENEVTTDPSDRATLEEEYTLELRTRDRERKLLKKIEKSLKMIDDGTYGYCEETGEPIGFWPGRRRPCRSRRRSAASACKSSTAIELEHCAGGDGHCARQPQRGARQAAAFPPRPVNSTNRKSRGATTLPP
jgi:DnaK suppressor protein